MDKLSELSANKKTSEPSDYSLIPFESSDSPSENDSEPSDSQPSKGELAQNQIANNLKPILLQSLAYDEISEEWVSKKANIWKPTSKVRAEAIVEDKLSSIKPTYSAGYLSSIFRLQRTRLIAPPWTDDPNLLPLENGVFDIRRRQLKPYEKYRFNWELPFGYDVNATCPTIETWLSSVTNNDSDMAHFLLCWIRAVLTGRYDLQKYVEIIGHGGTGKGTITRLLSSLIGDSNVVVTTLNLLEKNQFESSLLYGKRLLIITDSAHYGGDASALKAITGNDPLRYERKGIQAGQPFIFTGLVMIAGNENTQTTDHTSGLSRRKITVPFTHIVTDEEKTKCANFEKKLAEELPGLLNLLILLTEDEVTRTIRNPGAGISKAKFEAELDTNPILFWAHESLTCCKHGEESQIGLKPAKDEDPDYKRLYPHYLRFCENQGRQPVSLTRFSGLVVDNCISRNIETLKTRNNAGQTILRNLRLKDITEKQKLFSEGLKKALKTNLKTSQIGRAHV